MINYIKSNTIICITNKLRLGVQYRVANHDRGKRNESRSLERLIRKTEWRGDVTVVWFRGGRKINVTTPAGTRSMAISVAESADRPVYRRYSQERSDNRVNSDRI